MAYAAAVTYFRLYLRGNPNRKLCEWTGAFQGVAFQLLKTIVFCWVHCSMTKNFVNAEYNFIDCFASNRSIGWAVFTELLCPHFYLRLQSDWYVPRPQCVQASFSNMTAIAYWRIERIWAEFRVAALRFNLSCCYKVTSFDVIAHDNYS